MDDHTSRRADKDSWALEAPGLDEIEAAVATVATLCSVTPVLGWSALNRRLNGHLLVKAEGCNALARSSCAALLTASPNSTTASAIALQWLATKPIS
ncbi:hypothetical protein NKH72_12560 [Mesorhizobium sp. M0955]|uniref:hypothetical protein n=1 Tax=Mesorhizobium sp. M0955 TaxID=2957033 RepID=UPI00333C7C15